MLRVIHSSKRTSRSFTTATTTKVAPKVSVAASSLPDFTNGQAVYDRKTTTELVRALLVLRLCGVKALVDNAPQLLSIGERVLGRGLMTEILKATFFGHFCAGENQIDIKPTVSALDSAGVGSILDYAAEADEGQASAPVTTAPLASMPVARVYHYAGEETCDHHVDIFKNCIQAVHAVSPTGFAAIKVNPAVSTM
jgi:proline dehydrogenase